MYARPAYTRQTPLFIPDFRCFCRSRTLRGITVVVYPLIDSVLAHGPAVQQGLRVLMQGLHTRERERTKLLRFQQISFPFLEPLHVCASALSIWSSSSCTTDDITACCYCILFVFLFSRLAVLVCFSAHRIVLRRRGRRKWGRSFVERSRSQRVGGSSFAPDEGQFALLYCPGLLATLPGSYCCFICYFGCSRRENLCSVYLLPARFG